MNITPFKNEWLGRRVDYDHVDGYQCVDLVLEYIHENFGLSTGVSGNAIDYWTNPSALLLTKFDKIATTDVHEGDIIILYGLAGNADGHIMLGTGNENALQVEGLEQNGADGNGSGLGGDAIRTRFVDKTRIAGVLRPKAAAAPAAPVAAAPAPVVHPYTVETITPKQMRVKVPTSLWGLNYDNWSAMVANPVGHANEGDVVTVTAIAHHNLGSRYYMTSPTSGAGYNVVDLADYTAPAPAPAAPVAAPAVPAAVTAETPEIKYERLPAAVTYTTNKQPTNVWGFNHTSWAAIEADIVRQLNQGVEFVAVGRAYHSLGGVYLMTADDFGSADTTGSPTNYAGVNSVDLSGTTQPVVAAPLAVTSNIVASPEALAPGTVIAPITSPVETVPVTTTGNGPNTWKSSASNWQSTYKQTVRALVAKEAVVVKDLEGLLPSVKVEVGKLIPQAGVFWKDGQKFIRTIPSEAVGNWYGIPAEIGGLVSKDQQHKAEIVLENIWDKYHTEAEDAIDELFHEGMKFEDSAHASFSDLAASTSKLTGRDKWVDLAARLLFRKNKKQK